MSEINEIKDQQKVFRHSGVTDSFYRTFKHFCPSTSHINKQPEQHLILYKGSNYVFLPFKV